MSYRPIIGILHMFSCQNSTREKKKQFPLLSRPRQKKEGRVKGGICHRSQIDLTYNSNHIKDSWLTLGQTRHIFKTDTIGNTDEAIKIQSNIIRHFLKLQYPAWLETI